MSIYKTVSINQVIAKIIRDLGLANNSQEIPYQDFIEWIAEGLSFIDSYNQLKQKATSIDIEGFKGKLPCDFYKLIKIDKGYSYLDFSDNLIAEDVDLNILQNKIQQVSYSSSSYNINFDSITAGFKTGRIYIQYLAIPLDEDGYPLVPDDVSVFSALMWRVTYYLCLRGFEFKNKALMDINFCSRKKDFYTMQSRGTLNMPDGEMQERIKNRFIQLVPNINAYDDGFSTYTKMNGNNNAINSALKLF